MNQLLTEMDGFAGKKKNVFFIGATNRPDIIDTALIRPGRLDQLMYIPMPDYESRLSILKAALRHTPVSSDVDLEYLAARTDKFSGADLTEICQTACKLAIREDIIHDNDTKQLEDEMRDGSEEDMEDVEFLPELLPRHFEEAVQGARKSVSDRDLAQYQSFAKALQQSRGALTGPQGRSLMNFSFPRPQQNAEGGEGTSPTPMDEDECLPFRF
jgi:transitional endoplasmic reticulum ATPase